MTEKNTVNSVNPVALVTGGGKGIGAALCAKLAEAGHRVVVVDIDPEATANVAESCGGVAFEADVSDPKRNLAMVAEAVDRFGRLDVVVLNAGVSSDQPPDLPLDLDRYRRVLGVNIDGFPLLTSDDVAAAALTVLDTPGTGQAWTVVAGRPPRPFAFPPLPTTLMPDGTQAQFRPFLSKAPKKEDTP